MSFKSWHFVFCILSSMDAVLFFASRVLWRGSLLWLVLIGVMFAATLFVYFAKLRCPACGERVPEKDYVQNGFCSYCGEKLR